MFHYTIFDQGQSKLEIEMYVIIIEGIWSFERFDMLIQWYNLEIRFIFVLFMKNVIPLGNSFIVNRVTLVGS